jgi:signal peptidase II
MSKKSDSENVENLNTKNDMSQAKGTVQTTGTVSVKGLYIRRLLAILAVGLLAAADQLTKFIIRGSFSLHESRPVIEGVFSITYIRNEGIAWGMFQGGRIVFLIVTFLVLIFCFIAYNKMAGRRKFTPLRVCMVFLVAGSIGNMIDRLELGYVVDFFYFELIDFPVFNVADIYVTVSMIVLILLICFKYKEDDFDEIFSNKSRNQKRD